MATKETQLKAVARQAKKLAKTPARKAGGGTALSLYRAIAEQRPKGNFAGDSLRAEAAALKAERGPAPAAQGGYLAYLTARRAEEANALLNAAAARDRAESDALHRSSLQSYEDYLKKAIEATYGRVGGDKKGASEANVAQRAAILKTALEYAYTAEDGVTIALASGLSYEEALLIGEAVRQKGEAASGWTMQETQQRLKGTL